MSVSLINGWVDLRIGEIDDASYPSALSESCGFVVVGL